MDDKLNIIALDVEFVIHCVIEIRHANRSNPIRMKPCVHLSITASATAMLLAANLPREMTEPLVRAELLEKNLCNATEIRRIYAQYAAIRQQGIASSLGSRRAGLNALSVPLFDQSGGLVASITTLGMSPSFDAQLDGAAAQLLKKLGRELSSKMGRPTQP